MEACARPACTLSITVTSIGIFGTVLSGQCLILEPWVPAGPYRQMLGLLSPFQLLASASYDDTVKLYQEEGDDWVCCATLEGHESTVWSLAFDPSGQRLASCSDDRTVRIWRQYLPGNEQGEGPGVKGAFYSLPRYSLP